MTPPNAVTAALVLAPPCPYKVATAAELLPGLMPMIGMLAIGPRGQRPAPGNLRAAAPQPCRRREARPANPL
jgi:hypothetical protein